MCIVAASRQFNSTPRLTNATFFKQLWAARDRPALICFTSPSCGSCRLFKRVLPELASFAEQEKQFALNVFEVDAGENMGLTNEHGVKDLPALFLYSEGDFHASLQAPPVPELLYEEIQKALALPAEEAP